VTRNLEVYTKAYEGVKGNRTLVWKPHLGLANIDLEIGGKRTNLTVSPVHAAIIWHFQERSEWTTDDLAHVLKISTGVLRRRMTFWQAQGLIKEAAPDR
jgi:anaphase-promoting complex subunit 2